MSNFPLPVAHEDRTNPCQFIPDVEDCTGSGERMWKLVSKMSMTQGSSAGQSFGSVATDWQRKLITTFWSEDVNGFPWFDELFLLVAKKAGKSELSGKLLIGQALHNPIQRGNMICVAGTQTQAQYVYDSMASTIEHDSYLRERFLVRRYRSDIQDTKTSAILRAAAPEASTLVGVQPASYVVDELHILGNSPKAAGIVRQLSSGSAIFEKAKGIYITTAPLTRSEGIYQSMYSRAKRIHAGEAEGDRMLPVLFELPDKWLDDIENHQDAFWMANPNLDVTFPRSWLMEEFKQCKSDPDPSRYRNFLSQHLNVNTGESIGVDSWLPMDKWDAGAIPGMDLEWIKSNTTGLIASLDAGGSDDPTSLMIGGFKEDGSLYVWNHQWISIEGFKRRESQVHFQDFLDRGEMTVAPVGKDILEAIAIVRSIGSELRGLALDPNRMKAFRKMIEDADIETVNCPQNWRMSSFIAEADRLIFQGKIHHNGNTMLRWNMQNAKLAEKGRAVALEKPEGIGWSKNKIDGAICLIMVLQGRDELPEEFDVYSLIPS